MKIFKQHDFDLIVIGSGSGGGVGATFAASLGKKVALFERDAMGGECPNFACVPTKALLHAAHTYKTAQNAEQYGIKAQSLSVDYKQVKAWKDLVVSRTGSAEGESVFTGDGITVIRAEAKFVSPHQVVAGGQRFSAKKFLIASGTTNFIPPIPGLKEAGYLTFREAIDLTSLPKSLFIIGGGPIGCEFAEIFSSFDAKVYIADPLPRLLAKEDKEVGELVGAIFENNGVSVLTGSMVTKVETKAKKKVVHYKHGGKTLSVSVDEILVAAGKKPNVDLGLEYARVTYGNRGIVTNEYMQTSNPNVYAAGDIVGPYQFTHTAAYQSQVAAHNMFNRKKLRAEYDAIPRCVFVRPEVASVGLTEEEAAELKIKYKTGFAPIAILGRANTSNDGNGFVKVIADAKGVILGASIVSPRAGEMIHELTLAVKLGVRAKTIAETIHAFPTFSEAVKIACANIAE